MRSTEVKSPVRSIRSALQILLLTVATLFVCVSAFSQGSAGRILGGINDQTGGAVSGATVTIIDTQRNLTRTLTTDNAGEYNAPNLLPGTYTVRAVFQGFKTAERSGITLEVNQDLRVDLTLQPGEQTERVTVTEALPMVETTNAELGGTLSNQTINELPLNGRNFNNLLNLRPGVTVYPGASAWTQSTNGMRAKDNVYMVDGTYASDVWMGQSVMNAVMAAGDAGTILSIDSIDEFKTEQNPRAEYGWKPGSVVNMGIKSGTNSYHGTAFAFGRDGNWDALNYFRTAGPNGGTAQPQTPVELEQFGATLGGSIKKDKLFFFTAYEDQRYTIGPTGQHTVPITAPGVGDATNNLIAACQAALAAGAVGSGTPGALTALSAQLAGLSNTCTPLSNYPGLFQPNTGASGIFAPQNLPTQNTIDSGLGKIDYHLNDKHSINGMYFISPGRGVSNDSPAAQTNPLWESNLDARSQVFAGNWTYVPSATWVNEARVGFSHYTQNFFSVDHNQDPANFASNGSTYHFYTGQTNPFYFGFPSLTIQGFQGALGAGWPKVVGPDSTLQLLDHVSYLRGKHALKFGVEVLRFYSSSNVTANAKGPIQFDRLQDFFNGFPNGAPGCTPPTCPGGSTATILTGNLLRHFTEQSYAGFVQDDWRVKPRLIVNLGLRYELNTVQKERDGLQGVFDPTSQFGVVQTNSPYRGDHNNFSPRLGLAWDISGDGKTVLRMGGGLIYEQVSLDVFNGIGNSFGLRVPPTGATFAYCSPAITSGTCAAANSVNQAGPGNVNVINVAFTGTPIINNNTSGTIPFDWINNSASTPIYSLFTNPACGDSFTPLGATGFTPQQCNTMLVDPNFRTPYVTNWTVDLQRQLARNISLEVGYVGTHGTKLIGAQDINQPSCSTPGITACASGAAGPGWTVAAMNTCVTTFTCRPNTANEQLARPYDAKYPWLRFIDDFGNIDHSNYNGLQTVLTARNYHGLTLTTGYTYSHALGESSDQGTSGGLVIPINSYGSNKDQLYRDTTFDMRHRFTISGTYIIPGRKSPGQILQGWSVNSIVQIQTGTPWGVNDTNTDFAGIGEQNATGAQATQGSQWTFIGNPNDFKPQHNFTAVIPTTGGYTPCPTPIPSPLTFNCVSSAPGIPWFPGTKTAAVTPTSNAACNSAAAAQGGAAVAALRNLGCYALGSSVLIPAPYGGYGLGTRNLFRDQGYRNVDFSVTKAWKFGERLSAQFRAEFFNLLNRVDFTNPSGGPGGNSASLNAARAGSSGSGLGYAVNTPDQAGSNPVLGGGGARHVQLGLKLIF
jgi:hypothetical protein